MFNFFPQTDTKTRLSVLPAIRLALAQALVPILHQAFGHTTGKTLELARQLGMSQQGWQMAAGQCPENWQNEEEKEANGQPMGDGHHFHWDMGLINAEQIWIFSKFRS